MGGFMKLSGWSAVAALALAPLLVACSNADEIELVGDYSKAVKAGQVAVTGAAAEFNKAESAKREAYALANPRSVVRANTNECSASAASPGCRLVVVEKLPGGERRSLLNATAEEEFANLFAILAGVAEYSQLLADIIDASSVDKVRASAADAGKSLKSIATNKMLGVPSNVSAFSAPLSATLQWLLGSYVAQTQVSALRHLTAEGEKVLPPAYDHIGRLVVGLERGRRTVAAEEFRLSYNAFGAAPSRASLDRLRKAESQLHLASVAKPSAAVKKMREAHKALYDGLHGTNTQLKASKEQLAELRKSLEELASVIGEWVSAASAK